MRLRSGRVGKAFCFGRHCAVPLLLLASSSQHGKLAAIAVVLLLSAAVLFAERAAAVLACDVSYFSASLRRCCFRLRKPVTKSLHSTGICSSSQDAVGAPRLRLRHVASCSLMCFGVKHYFYSFLPLLCLLDVVEGTSFFTNMLWVVCQSVIVAIQHFLHIDPQYRSRIQQNAKQGTAFAGLLLSSKVTGPGVRQRQGTQHLCRVTAAF